MTFSELVDQQLPFFRVEHLAQSYGTSSGLLGASFENLIISTNKSYEADGVGVVKKNNVEVKTHAGRTFRSGKQTCDFDGYLTNVGFVGFDAKSTKEDYWRPPSETLHQFLYLYRGQKQTTRQTARFFYLLERRQRPITRWYLVEDLESIKRMGRYDFLDVDLLVNGRGTVLDYRAHLIKTKQPTLDA